MPYVDRMQKMQSETDKCYQKADEMKCIQCVNIKEVQHMYTS